MTFAHQHQPTASSFWKRTTDFLKHPLGAAILTFLLTGVAAALFSNWLERLSKSHDLELAAQKQAVDSVKSVTDLLYERAFRGKMLAASILREAPSDEIKERKKAYDEIFVRYNSTMQSNMFRLREMFHTSDYTKFEDLLEGPLHDLFVIQDGCLTASYDSVIASDDIKKKSAKTMLLHCPLNIPGSLHISKISDAILRCDYRYTDALYRIVEQSEYHDGNPISMREAEQAIGETCRLPKPMIDNSSSGSTSHVSPQ